MSESACGGGLMTPSERSSRSLRFSPLRCASFDCESNCDGAFCEGALAPGGFCEGAAVCACAAITGQPQTPAASMRIRDVRAVFEDMTFLLMFMGGNARYRRRVPVAR